MATDLSPTVKQTLQVTSLFATVLVVGIHYKSDVPDSPLLAYESANELIQEWFLGAIARVAVPMFALTAGLFYFRSYDGTFSGYLKKLDARVRTVFLPYFIVASSAFVFWLGVQRAREVQIELTLSEFVSMWLLHPPAEQLWFLRDLLVLVAIAPIVYRMTRTRLLATLSASGVFACWMLNAPVFPIVAGWHVIHIETLCFFTLGAVLAKRPAMLNRLAETSLPGTVVVATAWMALTVYRVCLRADFDIWYVEAYGIADLMIHQISILVGLVGLFLVAAQIQSRAPSLREWMVRLSGASFFVFLIHEYPLRAVVKEVAGQLLDPASSCWILFPVVTVLAYGFALWSGRQFPNATGILTGGRTPARARELGASPQTSVAQ
ncbi:MAG: acyltransferase [Planctomycetota bacterium]